MLNKTKEKIRAGTPVVGTSVSMDDRAANRAMAEAGFDFLLVDMQHSNLGVEALDRMIGRLSTGESEVLVRVLWNDGALINQALDLGADGVIIPMVNSGPEADRAVASAKYRPQGTRSWTPLRPEKYGGAEAYARVANDELLVLPQIETAEAVEGLDDILRVEGLDGVMVGPTDLAISLGHPPRLGVPEVNEVISQVQAGCESHGVPFGTFTGTLDNAEHWVGRGARIAVAGVDFVFLADGAARARERIDAMLGRRRESG